MLVSNKVRAAGIQVLFPEVKPQALIKGQIFGCLCPHDVCWMRKTNEPPGPCGLADKQQQFVNMIIFFEKGTFILSLCLENNNFIISKLKKLISAFILCFWTYAEHKFLFQPTHISSLWLTNLTHAFAGGS